MPSTHTRSAFFMVVFAALGAAACSSSSSSGGDGGAGAAGGDGGGGGETSGLADPCVVLAASDVAEVAGSPVTAKAEQFDASSRTCTWSTGSEAQDHNLIVYLYDSLNRFTKTDPAKQPDVGGVGDAAFLSGFATIRVKAKGKVFQAQAYRGDQYFTGAVSAEVAAAAGSTDSADAKAWEMAHRLAKKFAAKL